VLSGDDEDGGWETRVVLHIMSIKTVNHGGDSRGIRWRPLWRRRAWRRLTEGDVSRVRPQRTMTHGKGEVTIDSEFGGGRNDGVPVSVAVASVLIHTGALVTVNVTPGVMVTIVLERIDV
jgi:hypothetical protein